MAKGITKSLGENLRELISMDTLKDGAFIAGGSVSTSVLAGVAVNMINKAGKVAINPKSPVAKIIELLTSAGVATIGTMITKKASVGRLMMLGGMSAVMNDIVVESVLPTLSPSDYIDPSQMSDYLTLPPGMKDYLQVPGSRQMNDYLSVDQARGVSDYASVQQVASAVTAGGSGEDF